MNIRRKALQLQLNLNTIKVHKM